VLKYQLAFLREMALLKIEKVCRVSLGRKHCLNLGLDKPGRAVTTQTKP
jgi:hypothetical protein